MNLELNKAIVVIGKVIKEKCRNNPKIRLISNDSEEGKFELPFDKVEDNKWYEVYNDMGTFELTEICFINNIKDFDDWW